MAKKALNGQNELLAAKDDWQATKHDKRAHKAMRDRRKKKRDVWQAA